MAENKKSFILYADLITVVRKLVLKDRQDKTNYAGELFLTILMYVNDKDPVPTDFIVEMAFEPIKLALKRDLIKYETYIKKQKVNGAKGGRPKKTQKTQAFILKPKKADSVTDSDSDITTTNTEAEVDFKKIDLWIKDLPNQHSYLEGIYRLNKLMKGSLGIIALDFKEHLKVYPKKHINFSDFKKHFASFVSMQNSKGRLDRHKSQSKGQL